MLSWEGKRSPARVTVPSIRLVELFAPAQPFLSQAARTSGGPEAGNLLFEGDNKLVLAHLLAGGRRGQVDLVYIDPPFDSGTDYPRRARLRGPAAQAVRLDLDEPLQYADNWPDDSYLQFMYERLLLIRELLAENGSLYVHLDSHRSHAVKLICDEVFGPGCFQREIVWRIGWVSGFKSRARNWIRNHDTILYYTRSPGGRTYFNKEYVPHPSGYRRRDGKPPTGPGYPVEDTWNCSEMDRLDSIQIMSFSGEKVGFSTQKNENLLARIINASCPPDGLVLDCFLGAGTTAAVAQKLGRRWIGCDNSRSAIHTASRRLQGIILDQAEAAKGEAAGRLPMGMRTYRVGDGGLPVAMPEAETGRGARGLASRQAAHAPAHATLRVERRAGPEGRRSGAIEEARTEHLAIEIEEFVSPAIADLVARQGGARLDDWRAMVDTILIDVAHNGEVFSATAADVPRRRSELVRGRYELEAPPGPTTVAVKITDVLGEELLLTCPA